MKKTVLATAISSLAGGVFLSLSPFALAQESATNATTDVMLVTATKRTEPITNLITPVIEITKEDIDKTQAQTLTEVLRQLPGVQITTTGGDSQTTRVYVRGSNNVVVLFNGMRLGGASAGYSDVSQLPLAGVQKIEYLRGSRAAVYGADATAGVINIITSSSNTETTGSVKATGGSYGYQSYTGSVAMVPSDKSWVNITTQYRHSDNYDVNQFYDEDKDGYENTNVVADWGVRLQDNWIIRMNGYYHKGATEYDGEDYDQNFNSITDSNFRNQVENYSINGQLIYTTDIFTSSFSYGYSQDQLESVPVSYNSKYETNRNEVLWRNSWSITQEDSFDFGFEYRNDNLNNSNVDYQKDERDNKAAYLNLSHNGELIQIEGSVRLDDDEQFGSKATWQLGAGWQIIEQLRLTSSIGTGFKAPSFDQLYSSFSGNPDLDAEESTNYEIALEGEHSFLSWRLAGFYNDIDNRVVYIGSNYQNTNQDLKVKGIEWVGSFDTGPIYHQVSLQYLKPEDKNTGKDAIRIARQSYKWQVGYQSDNWQANMSYVYQGKSYDTAYYPDYTSERVKLDGYSLVNLAASYDITVNWVVSARIDNLFDADYETVATYIEPERTYYGSIAYQF